MSQPEFGSASPGGYGGQQKANIYTVLLIVALVALLIGCVFLYLEISAYGGFGEVKGPVGAITLPLDVTADFVAAHHLV